MSGAEKPNYRRALNQISNGEPLKSYDYPIQPPKLAPGVVPDGKAAPVLAADSFPSYVTADMMLPGGGFPGYPYLSQLAARTEYRAFASSLSTELTREWIEFTSKENSGSETSGKIKQIEAEFERLGVREVIRKAAEQDCYFGRGQIFFDIDGADRSTPLILDPRTVKKGSLRRLTTVEAIWTTPSAYNALDPAAPDFYRPTEWWMVGQRIHASRLATVVTRELPDILKPAFNFSGISLSQLAEPYVDNWLRTRQSVSDLINNFSMTTLSTAMDQLLMGDADLKARVDLFQAYKSNKGLMLLDKEREEMGQINTPLSGLSELQAQSQEHMCSASRIPAIVLTGISPSGLNATSDGEIRVFNDWIAAQQEAYWRVPIRTALILAQLNLFSEVDPDIGFRFKPLTRMTPGELADIRNKDAITDSAYIDRGVVDPSEVRKKLADDPNSGFDGLDADAIIDAPDYDPSIDESHGKA